jgi:hypothetical protein
MKRSLFLIFALATIAVLLSWSFHAVEIPSDDVIGSQYKRSYRVVGAPMLVRVSDAKDGTAIFWYDNDHGPQPIKIDKRADDEWIVTLRRHNQ